MFSDEKKRKPIRSSVKKEVYQRARGKCERCGIKMKPRQGNYHHTRSPSISPTAKTVQFLCPNCHSWYGHTSKTKIERGFLSDTKVVTVKRQRVKKVPSSSSTKSKGKSKKSTSSTKKKATSKSRKSTRKAKKAPARSRTKSGRFRKKRSDAGKKRS